MRVCATPGCPESMEGRDPRALYHDDACRARHWKQRRGYGPQKPPHVRSHGPGGAQVSFNRALRAAERMALFLGADDLTAQRTAYAFMAGALPTRQLQRLQERER